MKKEHNNEWNIEEIIEKTPETEYIEENIYIDEKFLKNKSLIRMDMNLIQSPIFSKNTKRKINQVITYFFNKNKNTYIKITPRSGDYIPGETEEKIFIVLMQIMKEQNMSKKFITTATEIKEKLKLNTTRYGAIIRNSLLRLSTTNYSFKNTLYSSELKGVFNEEIVTTMFSMRIINLTVKENSKYRHLINDRRIKEIYEINISNHFYKNIIQKGYLVYNGDTLLDIEISTARSIYMLIEKLRFSNLYLKIDTIFLIKRIPLKLSKKTLSTTIKTLEKAFGELIEKGLISKFNFIKEQTWLSSEIEIYFPENANSDKQERFYEDRNDFKKILTSNTISDSEQIMLLDISDVEKNEIDIIDKDKIITSEKISSILELLPENAKKLKTMKKTIKNSIEIYGMKNVLLAAKYLKKQKRVLSPRSFFIKTLENKWFDVNLDEIEIKKIESKILLDDKKEEKELEQKKLEKLYQKFETLPLELKEDLEKNVYDEYIEKCGMESKIQKLAFTKAKRKLISEYLKKNPEILNKCISGEIEKDLIDSSNCNLEVITNRKVFKDHIDEYINLYQELMKIEENKMEEIRKKVVLDCMDLFINEVLTLEKLQEIIKKNLLGGN